LMNFLDAKNDTKWWTFGWWDENDDELVQKAIEIILETRKASATLLQRKLGVWFARAARIMDMLEEKWIVWPQEWAKPRDILI
jgi:S-DNA-T family DNA segregation ATPase FtsK/SpoIIIE